MEKYNKTAINYSKRKFEGYRSELLTVWERGADIAGEGVEQ